MFGCGTASWETHTDDVYIPSPCLWKEPECDLFCLSCNLDVLVEVLQLILPPSAEDIILDKDTAHPYLAVSPDGKCVKSVTKKQDVPDKPERFDTMPAVLGRNSFSSGSHYWEVDVTGNSKWTIGVCEDSVNRKGQYLSAKTQSGFWTLCLKDGTYKALSVSHHVLHVAGPLLRVGIFLRYEEGLISFYNVTEYTILHTFKSEFTEPLRPYFYPEPAGEKSTNGLTIVKVPAADPDVPSRA